MEGINNMCLKYNTQEHHFAYKKTSNKNLIVEKTD
jgi:hypothetical protein